MKQMREEEYPLIQTAGSDNNHPPYNTAQYEKVRQLTPMGLR